MQINDAKSITGEVVTLLIDETIYPLGFARPGRQFCPTRSIPLSNTNGQALASVSST